MSDRAGGPPSRRGAFNWLLLGLVLANVVLQLCGALLAKYSVRVPASEFWALALIVGLILLLNLVRLVVWNAMHRRFPVSLAYPATALFFPCLVAMAYLLGEPVRAMQVAGAGLVTAGVLVLLTGDEDTSA
jgi:drug/metabolite transporter (DMT)-like permease